ncbi:MAG: hypothetical protein RI953_1612 [Pseudomonadota bacterium]|jgi:hypothetical protein
MKKNTFSFRYSRLWLVELLVCFACVFVLPEGNSARAAELAVEGDVDSTPAEIRQLVERSNILDSKIRELEKRIDTTQRSVLGSENRALVDYRLELKPSNPSPDGGRNFDKMLVSHIRMAMDGRPFVYSQSAIIVSESNPLPLFLGKISEGIHQVRLQFQAAQLDRGLVSSGNMAWMAVDKIFNIEISAKGGTFQKQTITIVDGTEAMSAKESQKQENDKTATSSRIGEFRKETR